ncbi:DUF6183 family protein [Streptomyces sp. NPDC048370]|uniref:DUF6183 family protein n=1 Tax=Streptomyces sp. NPDC048370 TaxID=3365540 RepID=UPI003715A592
MPEPTATPLPNDASLKVYAATAPEKLYDLATEPARGARTWSDPDILRLVEFLTAGHSQAATDCAVRLGEHAARLGEAPGAAALMDHVTRELVQRPSSAKLRPHFEKPPVADDPTTEFRACLLHEMALRWGLRDEPYVTFQAGLRELGHPLSWLPLASFHFENAMRRRAWTRGTMLSSLRPDELYAAYPAVPPTAAGAEAGRAALRVRDERRTEAAVAPLAELGICAAEFFTLPEPLDPVDFNSALLTSLGSTCLAGFTPETLAAAHTTADDVAGDLFVPAFDGGMWGDGRPRPYSRLVTWRSLYALMDLDLSVELGDAVRAAAEHRWLRLAPGRSDFFFGDLSDLAFAVLDPTRTRVGVIAASDTD